MTRPNVLLVTTDHWMGDLLGCAGHPAVLTPTLDSLAESGIRFPNADSECPVCVPGRRCLTLGQSPSEHGVNDNSSVPFPEGATTLPQAFRDAGYQAQAVGKLHVKPRRSRIGFDEVLLDEEGRAKPDDYDIFLGDHGHPGKRFAGGMCNNDYCWRPWHLDEDLHVTNWATQQMCRQIRRRDPDKPAFWYLSYSHPHPPLEPLRDYIEMYRDVEPPEAVLGDWCGTDPYSGRERSRIADVRRAFYALCTHIDHQLRVVLGTLREQGLINDTIIAFTSDHGDMLGDQGRWAKRVFYRPSCNVPMILLGTAAQREVNTGRIDDRLVGLADVMPTLCELAGVPVPPSCSGLSMIGDCKREHSYGECGVEGQRMVRTRKHKLVWTICGSHFQLFDCVADRAERRNLAADPAYSSTFDALRGELLSRLSDVDRERFVKSGELVGIPAREQTHPDQRGLNAQRGLQWP